MRAKSTQSTNKAVLSAKLKSFIGSASVSVANSADFEFELNGQSPMLSSMRIIQKIICCLSMRHVMFGLGMRAMITITIDCLGFRMCLNYKMRAQRNSNVPMAMSDSENENIIIIIVSRNKSEEFWAERLCLRTIRD